MTLVQKFGGGILATKQDFQHVASVIEKTKPTAVVVSAVQGITDEFIQLISKARNGKTSKTQLEALKQKHILLENENNNKSNNKNKTKNESDNKNKTEIENEFDKIEKLLKGIKYTGECSEKLYAQIVSRGEYLSALILSSYLPGYTFWPAENGINANGSYSNSRNDISKTKKPPMHSIITGFYGVNEAGEVCLFGRGGTDYTAAIIARTLNADKLEFWKNVDGFLTADPRIVKNAKFIESLSFEEASEICRFGAKILHPSAMEPLIGTKTIIEIKNVEKPQNKGTIISQGENKSEVAAVTGRQNIAAISVSGDEMVEAFGIASKILTRVANSNISVDVIATGQANISFTISEKDAENALNSLRDLNANFNISKKADLALVGVVGIGIKRNPQVLSRIFSALSAENIGVEMVSQGASEIDFSLIVENSNYEKAIKAIHEEFFKK